MYGRQQATGQKQATGNISITVALTVDLRDVSTTLDADADVQVLHLVLAHDQDGLEHLVAQNLRRDQLQGLACRSRMRA